MLPAGTLDAPPISDDYLLCSGSRAFLLESAFLLFIRIMWAEDLIYSYFVFHLSNLSLIYSETLNYF
jgi:hypothetical protein